jgi:predicted O-methyltransferase YrrM
MTSVRAYVEAGHAAWRIKRVPHPIASDAAFAFTQTFPDEGPAAISANQKPDEIAWLLELVRELRPQTVLEIGTARGGTLFLWTRVAAPDALLVTVDQRRLIGRLGRLSPHALVRLSFARDRQRIVLVDAVDSQAQSTLERVQAALGDRKVDFLFIDADHSYEGVTRDFDLYSPLVRGGGIVAFHDISPNARSHTHGTVRFWEELKEKGETEERVAPGEEGYGIGVYHVPR